MSFFSVDELSRIYSKVRQWPLDYRAWPVFNWVPRKNSVEIHIFFMFDGDAMRSDQEIYLEDWPDPQDWTEEDIDRFADQMWEEFKDNLEMYIKDNG